MFDSSRRARGICDACKVRQEETIRTEKAREQQRRMAYARKVVAEHPEICPAVLKLLGMSDLQKDFWVEEHAYAQICGLHNTVVKARNFETARRFEDAATVYESLGLWQEAGRVREKKDSKTVKHVTVNLNELINSLKTGGLAVPYKCSGCGATITIDRNTSADALKFCSYCGSAINVDALTNLLKDALK
ncbi:MAG: hypothetical protein MUC90_08690 [Thermoplasmata archaeon]|nr:hypothetical protein [Thermoplasmata archaeon]